MKHFGERERERERAAAAAAAIHNFQHIPIFCPKKKLTRSSQIHAAQAGARHLEKNPRIFFYNNKKIYRLENLSRTHPFFFG